jgi:NOL1/NOP2/fmu family ribosome biogenesis protein
MIEEQRINRKHAKIALKGHCLVCIDGFPVGWAKWQEGMLKNEYPAGWRWLS